MPVTQTNSLVLLEYVVGVLIHLSPPTLHTYIHFFSLADSLIVLSVHSRLAVGCIENKDPKE